MKWNAMTLRTVVHIRDCDRAARFFLPAATALLASCAASLPHRMNELGKVMDAVADRQAEFGTMTVSAPILSDPGDVFQFNLSEGPEDFYSDAKNNIQGAASEFQQQISSFGLGLNLSLSPTQAAAYNDQVKQYYAALKKPAQVQGSTPKTPTVGDALDQYLTIALGQAGQESDPRTKLQIIQNAINTYAALATMQSQPAPAAPSKTSAPVFPTAAFPTTAPSNLVVPTTLPSTVFANSPSSQLFTAFQQLAGGQRAPVPADRTALITAAGDTAVKAMFQIMGNPTAANKFTDKRILFGVSTVSVNPGWRTSKNYAANVAIQSRYRWQTARPTILLEFVKNPEIPADVRIRLALDQKVALPQDRAAMESIFRLCPAIAQIATNQHIDPTRYWDENLDDYQSVIDRDALSKTLGTPSIPESYQFNPVSDDGPDVAAVSPLTDVQTLDLSSGFRQQEQIAINLAFALQLAGLKAQASTFLEYAKSLEQDFSTVTPNVTANSFSNGVTFGFQVGPQLRAIQRAQAGKYSGPGLVLERQSFPALVVYGFDAAKISPQIDVDKGRFILKEPRVELHTEDNWLPIDGKHERFTETERLRLGYWLRKDVKAAQDELAQNSLKDFITLRADTLAQSTGVNVIQVVLPESVVSPPRKPTVTHIEPASIELPPPGQQKQVAIVLEGSNLDTVQLDKMRMVSGGRMLTDGANAPRRSGDVIWANVLLDPSDDPAPIIFALPSASGGTYTLPLKPMSDSMPEVYAVAPQSISLETDSGGKWVPVEADLYIVGHGLDLIDWQRVHPATSSGIESVPVFSPNKNVLHEHVRVVSPAAPTAFILPRANGGELFTPPLTIAGKKLSVVVHAAHAGDSGTKTSSASDTVHSAAGRRSAAQPGTAGDVTITAGDGQVTLMWKTVEGATSYRVDYGEFASVGQDKVNQSVEAIASPPKTISGLKNDTSYYFMVSAAVGGKPVAVGAVKATPTSPPPAQPVRAPTDPAATAPRVTNSSGGDKPGSENKSAYENDTDASVEFSPGVEPDVVKTFIVAATTRPAPAKSAGGEKAGAQNAASVEADVKFTQGSPSSNTTDNASDDASHRTGQVR
ncbi:MAG TPA: hypothetical protein VFE58_05920 [Tepidisphaeraceae bacterium]|jgi:hypothetical protein|nr:hypothetical protein [Tepidisphaeraceae bacterium]